MRKVVFTLIISVWWVVGGLAYTGHADEIVMGSGDWCPYVCDPAKHDGKYGYLPDIAKIIFKRAGHSFRMQYLPFVRVIQQAREGKLAGIPGVYHGDVPDFIFPGVPQGIGVNTFYVKKGTSWKFKGKNSLRQLSVLGVIRDYYYGDEVHNFMETSPSHVEILHGIDPQQRSLMLLKQGRIMAWVEDNQVAQYNIKRMYLEDEIVPAGDLGEELPVYIAFSPGVEKAQEYVRLLEDGVEELRRTGELETILAGYGLRDWEEGGQ